MPTKTINFADLDKYLGKQSRYLSSQLIDVNHGIDALDNCKSVINGTIALIESLRVDVHSLALMDLPAEALKYETPLKYVEPKEAASS